MTFEIGVGANLAEKQSLFQNASTNGVLLKENYSSTAGFIPNVTTFQHGIVHVNSCLIPGLHDSMCMWLEKAALE